MVETKNCWETVTLLINIFLDRFYHNSRAPFPKHQLFKPTRVQKKWKFTPLKARIGKVLRLARTFTHAALPSSRVFLGVKHEIFNRVRFRWADLGYRGLQWWSHYQMYFSEQRSPDFPCSTASSMESMTVAYLSSKSMLKRKSMINIDNLKDCWRKGKSCFRFVSCGLCCAV